MSLRSVVAGALLAIAMAACAGAGDADYAETEVSPELDAKADATTEVAVRAGETTLWVNKTVALRDGVNGQELVLRGRTSRTLTDGRGYIFDDVYGQWAQKSARVFELTWSPSEIRGLADGVDQLIGMSFTHSSSRPDALTARAVVRPRLTTFTGSSKIYLVAELTPVLVAGETVYRISGRTYGANTGIRLVIDNADVGTVTRDGSERFSIDVNPNLLLAEIARNGELQIIADAPTGGVDKRVHVGLALKKLAMTSGDVEAAFPPVSCTATVKACLQALPDSALDLSSCGEAIKVNACGNSVGVRVTDVAFQAALHATGQYLATAAARAEAVALVGADRADQFLGGAEQTVESQLEKMFGRWYLSTATRDAQLELERSRGLDHAYAYPMDFTEPHAAQPGNAAAMRQVAADAVLAELARMDFVHSEFARSLDDLTHEYKAQHLADIKAFRETVVAEPYMTTKDVYVGSWLGLYTEVVIDRATGAVESTLVEID
jgi:hypothetical protein